MDTQKQQIVDSLKQANNVLVTVSNNPSVDQLATCIGVTLALNKMKKHATAVFSGTVPPIISFLEPEKTLEKTTDSLRDFIIAIDKSKADKLRYKVEDKFVKIFITPYRTSISEKDLAFSEGDFNVDVVLALGVHKQADLDQTITAHGRILHDATVISINNLPNIELGSINLLDTQASSLSEIAVGILNLLDQSMIDSQIATTLLTGIVAETDRFRNAKTTPTTMSLSAELLTAGANQQLVASKLETPPPPSPIAQMGPAPDTQATPSADKRDDGTLQISHDDDTKKQATISVSTGDEPKPSQIHIDDNGHFHPLEEHKGPETLGSNLVMSPPASLPPLPPLQPTPPMPPSPNPFPPLNSNPPAPLTPPSPLNPFAPQQPFAPINNNLGGGLGLPPLNNGMGTNNVSPPAGNQFGPMGRSTGMSPASLPPLPPLQPTPPMPPSPNPFPPLNSNPPAPLTPPSPLNPFAPQQPQQVVPSVVDPAIIQPDPNAVLAQQTASEESLFPPNNLPPTIHTEGPHLMMQPPTFGSQLSAGGMPQNDDEEAPSGTPMSLPSLEHPGALLDREPLRQPSARPALPPPPLSSPPSPSMSLPPPPPPKVDSSPATPVLGGDQTEPPLIAEESLSSLERDVNSSHLDYIESPIPNLSPPATPVASVPSVAASPVPATTSSTVGDYDQAADVRSARSAIDAAFQKGGDAEESPLEPVVSLNAQPLGAPLHESESNDSSLPPGFSGDSNSGVPPPPPVPPPMIPPTPS